MRRIISYLIILTFACNAIAQDVTFQKFETGVAPVIDGYIDACWNDIDIYYIEKPSLWNTGYPTIDIATWQAAWNDTAIFVLVTVDEDDHCDQWCSGATEWESDRPELYFDVNVGNLDDGDGPANWPNGHYQVAPGWIQYENNYYTCEVSWMELSYCYGYSISGEDYIYEYSVPFTSLKDEYDIILDPATNPTIGFDVHIQDRDEGDTHVQTIVWMNDGSGPSSNQNWFNMDDCGEANFESGGSSIEPDGVFKKLPEGAAPVIDGFADALLYDVDIYSIDRPLLSNPGAPTLDLATWQAVWNDTAIFVLVTVEEDDHCDQWCSGVVEWESDRAEIYFDVNVGNLDDGDGPMNWPNGHYQFAPAWMEYENNYNVCEVSWMGPSYCYGYSISGEDYLYEYSIPFSSLLDKYDDALDPDTDPVIGFDVYICDRDEGDTDYQLMAWINDLSGPAGTHSWANMDDCGKVTFEEESDITCNYDYSGTEPSVYFISFYYIEDSSYDIEMKLFDIGTCDTLSLYVTSVTVNEDMRIDFEPPDYGYFEVGAISDQGNTIVGYYDIGNTGCGASDSRVWTVSRITPVPDAPVTIFPTNNLFIFSDEVKLQWNAVSGAKNYTVQVSDEEDFSSLFASISSIASASYTVSGLESSTTYYWRVNCSNNCDDSDWSETKMFHTGLLTIGSDLTEYNSGYLVYPSPADYYINIQCPGLSNSVISIFTVDGKLVIQEYVYDDIATINVSDLTKGLYYIQAVNESTSWTGKIIIE